MAKKDKTLAMAGPMTASPTDYMAEDDHRTMMRAAEVRSDPKRMAGVKRHHAKQRTALGRVGRTFGGRR